MTIGAPPAETLSADVIVVGSGGAGLCAAAAASRSGAGVILVTKGKAGAANATAYAGGGFTVSPAPGGSGAGPEATLPEGGESLAEEPSLEMTPEEHFRLSLETGRFLCRPGLLRALCFEGPRAMRELERDYGVRLEWFSRGCSVHRYGRPPLLGGLGLTRPLLTYLRRAGVRVIEGTVVTAIIRDGDAPARGQVRGVVAVVPDSGQTIHLAAGAVVVATGGGGAIYGRTDNPPRMTGDGYALLAQAGASLEDMEFVQFYPLGVAEPGLPARLLDTSLLDLARLTDENGDEPLAGRLEEWGFSSGAEINLYARDRAAVALGRHLAGGHKLLLHTEELDPAGLPDDYLTRLREMFPRSLDPFSRPVAVAPTQHYFCGGAMISVSGEVLGDGGVIPGLYACGEVTGGVDGANRVGGNALTNIVTFGLAVGKAAAAHAAKTRGRREGLDGTGLPPSAVEGIGPGTASSLSGRRIGSERPALLRRELHALCDRHLGPVRTEAGLRAALSGLDELGRRAAEVATPSRADFLLALEMDFALASAGFVARAALARTESRGCHFRLDHPAEDPAWARHVVLGPEGPSTSRTGPPRG
jgi:succinate dehydrogenase/fumarate reductase flavoprotein subunit